MEEEPRTVTFKAFYWNYTETEENELEIHIGGRTAPDPETGETQSVHCVVENFTPFVYLELPKRIKWNRAKCIAVVEYFKKVMKTEGPIGYKLLQKYKLQYKELFNCIWLTFPTNKAAQNLARRCHNAKSNLFIDGVGVFRSKEFVVHETNLDPLLKFTASKRLKLASWITATETIKPGEAELSVEDRKFTTADIDLYADWQDVDAFVPEGMVIVRPKYVSFDIECNSKNHNSRLPDPEFPENCVFQIACTVGRFGENPKFRKMHLFTLYNPHDIPDVTVIRCASEKDLFLKWRAFVEEENPDAFVTYNGMKFDWNYMIHRAEKLGIYMKFAQISRIIGQRAENRQAAWSSSAYGEQKFRYLDPMGRTNVDVLLEIERNYKLPQYGLNAVGEYFLKEHKDDITPRQLFMLFQLTVEIGPIVDAFPKGVVKKETRIEIKKRIQEILQMRRCHGVVRELRTDLMNAKKGIEFQNLVRNALTLTGTYCVQDTVLPINLCEKLNLWTTMEETSNCMNVPMSYLHTRGQQIKVLAQVYRDTIFNDIIIPYKDKPKDGASEKYEGAIVIEANPGDYNNVVCFDFESLYPSIMIAYNICHTTLLRPDDPTPPEECHVLEINTHVGCPHDPQKRKKKKEDIMCFQHVHRFKKVIIHPDGTRENEGIMAKLVRNLLAERKVKKKEMAKLEAKMKMAKGLAQEEDIAFYKKMGWPIIEKGSLTEQELEILDVEIKVLNAQQLALKVSANSSYGTLGAQTGPIPLVQGAEAVTGMGRMLIMKAVEYILKKYDCAKLVYGDTDSSMITFKGKTTEESFLMGDKISKETSHYLKTLLLGLPEDYSITCPEDGVSYRIDKYPRDKMEFLSDEEKINIHRYDACPINLQFENLYKRYLLLSKKRYVAYAVNRKGEIVSRIKKGVVLARRDNCQYLRDTYKMLTDGVLENYDETTIMNTLYNQVHKLFTRQVPDANLIIYTGIKTIMNYAKKKEKKQGRTVIDRVFLDEEGEAIDDPFGPLDPRLVYPNLPQVLLSLKMLRRGDDIPPNTRLEYLYLEKEGAEHQGEKAEDYTYYRENKDLVEMKPDYLHYIEKQLSKPITELLEVKYPRVRIPYEKLDDALERVLETLDDLIKHRSKELKVYERKVAERHDSIRYGWAAKWCKVCKTKFPKLCSKHNPKTECRTYVYRRKMAQVQYILDSAERKRLNPKAKNEVDEKKYPEVIAVCKRYKARHILDTLYSQHAIRKRPAKRATQTGEKLRIKTKDEFVKVLLTKDLKGGHKKGDLVTLKDIRQEEDKTSRSARAKYKYFYTIQCADGSVIENVPRDSITTWYYKDGTVMKDILIARGSYRTVVKELKKLFDPLQFVGAEDRGTEFFEVPDDNLDDE